MPRIPVHTLDDAPEQTRPTLQALQKKMGKLLNIHAEMAHSPVVLAAYSGVQHAITDHGSFDAPTREAIALAVGAVDGCDYCQAAHTLGGKAAGLSPEQMLAIRGGRPSGDDKLDACSRSSARPPGGSVPSRTPPGGRPRPPAGPTSSSPRRSRT